MIVSTQMAVLPVPRSPMISSRWPRPIGIIESIALMPVCSGSFTGWRSTTPGALNSIGRRLGGLDRGAAVERVAERVDDAADQRVADRHRHDLAGAADGVALLDLLPLAEEHRGDVVLLEVQREAGDAVVELELLERDAAVEPVDAGDAVADLDDGADLLDVGLRPRSARSRTLRMLAISSGRSFTLHSQRASGVRIERAAEVLQPAPDGCVQEDAAGAQDDARR